MLLLSPPALPQACLVRDQMAFTLEALHPPSVKSVTIVEVFKDYICILALVNTIMCMKQLVEIAKQVHIKQYNNTQGSSFLLEKGTAPGGTQTHNHPHSLYHLSYQSSPAGWLQCQLHNARQWCYSMVNCEYYVTVILSMHGIKNGLTECVTTLLHTHYK